MKKLNRKGFTLIELLAVIVILAIIMVVTIPTVLNSMGNARQNTLQTSANTVADWVEKEYALAMIGGTDAALGGADSSFTGFCTSAKGYCQQASAVTAGTAPQDNKAPTGAALTDTTAKTMLKAAGVDPANYSYVSIKLTNGRACVILGAAKSPGQFGTVNDALVQSTGC